MTGPWQGAETSIIPYQHRLSVRQHARRSLGPQAQQAERLMPSHHFSAAAALAVVSALPWLPLHGGGISSAQG